MLSQDRKLKMFFKNRKNGIEKVKNNIKMPNKLQGKIQG